MFAEIASTAGEFVSYAWEKSCRSWRVQESKMPMPSKIAVTVGEFGEIH